MNMEILTATLLSFAILSLIRTDSSFAHGNDTEQHVDREYVKTLLRSGEYEEFEELLQIDHVDLEKTECETELDDLSLKRHQTEEERQSLNFGKTPNKKWENNVVPYVILPEGYTKKHIEIIEKAIKSFNTQVKNVQFRKRKNEKDYVSIYAGKNGCYSHVGRTAGINKLGLEPPNCLREGTIQHEMMHLLGFTHQHMSPNRDKYITVLYDNIPKEWHPNYNKESAEKFNVVGEYDYYSIMHYPMKAPKSSKPAFKILKKNVSDKGIGQRLAMTKYDVEKIDNLYSVKESPKTPIYTRRKDRRRKYSRYDNN